MANISDAYGHISLEGPWSEEDIYNFLKVVEVLDDGSDYPTCLEGNNFEDRLRILSRDLNISFNGCGRWTFQANLEAFDEWTNQSVLRAYELNSKNEHSNIKKKLIDAMLSKDLKIVWSFVEFEPGFAFLCQQEGVHTATVDGTIKYAVNSSDCFDSTLKNYVDIFCDGDEESLDSYAWNVCDYLSIDPKMWVDTVVNLIKLHPTWYDIFGDGSLYNDIPDQLGKDVMKTVVAKGITYDNR